MRVVWLLVALSLFSLALYSVVASFNSPPQTFDSAAVADTYLSSYFAGGAFGGSTALVVSDGQGYANWTLVLFGIAGRLRPSDRVVEAHIELVVIQSSQAGWPSDLATGRTLTPWNESTVSFAAKPIFAFDTSTLTSLSKNPGSGTVVTIDVTKQLSRWHSYEGPSNFGTVLKWSQNAGAVSLAFASRENTASAGPKLVVKFMPGPTTIYGYGVGVDHGTVSAAYSRVE